MSRDYRLYLDDINTSAAKVMQYVNGLSYEEFAADERTFDAVVFNLEVIGEAVKHIPETMRSRYPAIDWRRIAGLRDMIAHGYFGLNRRLLWNIVQTQLPELHKQVRQILKAEDEE